MSDIKKIKYYKPRIPKNERRRGKKALIISLSVLGGLLLLVAAFFAWLTITEYNPADKEELTADKNAEAVTLEKEFSVLSWNIGYSGLGKYEDFVMDGGKTDGSPDTEERFKSYLDGIIKILRENESDFYIMQEVDKNAKRSYHYDEATSLATALSVANSVFATNYKCNFVPFPWPPIGQVESGIVTMSMAEVLDGKADRISLPNSFTWPMRIAYLKRCLLVTRFEVPDTDKQLVLINFHLEAYDGSDASNAQIEELWKLMKEEYEKGNYVIAGGDFNQAMPGSLEKFPLSSSKIWTPGVFNTSIIPDGWRVVFDNDVPSCRSLDKPLEGAKDMQYYVIDGFLISPNVELTSVHAIDTGFEYTDHNPVKMQVKLK